jgi:hypothetical protein
VRLLPPLLHAGLARRTVIAIYHQVCFRPYTISYVADERVNDAEFFQLQHLSLNSKATVLWRETL